MNTVTILEEIRRIKSIADIGLLYCNSEYDKERYLELQSIAYNLLHKISEHSVEELKETFPSLKDYPTPKVDIRGMALSADNKILLVKESVDGKWSLPGGWADIGYSPKEIVIKEFYEETGLTIVPERLLAVFDKKHHAYPPQPFYVYKMVFHCSICSEKINKGFDVLDVQYFEINNLPELSEDRILKSQLELLYDKIITNNDEVYSD